MILRTQKLRRERDTLIVLIRWALRRWKLNTRWPCPDCGREGPTRPLRQLNVLQENGDQVWLGCHYCNNDDWVAEAERILGLITRSQETEGKCLTAR